MGQQLVTYISTASKTSGVENKNNGVIPIWDLAISKPFYKMAASGTTEKVGMTPPELPIWSVPNSEVKIAPNVNSSRKQRDGSPLSGCDIHLKPNFGDGQSSVVTTWPADGENLGVTNTVFLVGGLPHNKVQNLNTGSGLSNTYV